MKLFLIVFASFALASAGMTEEFNLLFSREISGVDTSEFDPSGVKSLEKAENNTSSKPSNTQTKKNDEDGKTETAETKKPTESTESVKSTESAETKEKPNPTPITNPTQSKTPEYLKQVSPQFFQGMPGGNGLGLLPYDAGRQPGFDLNENVEDPFAQMREELIALVGEDVYDKMVWTFWDLKEFDSALYAKISQYDLLIQEWVVSVQEIFGLNDQMRAEWMIFGNADAYTIRLRAESLNSQHSQMQQSVIDGLSEQRLKHATIADVETHSLFFNAIKYLTLNNLLYLMLFLLGLVLVAKLFRFMVRQQ